MSYVGVDWAGSCWVVVAIGDEITVSTEPSILNVWTAYEADAASILVDVPIGLPEDGDWACDRAAAHLLESRSSSVFSIPCRAAVTAETYEEARDACGGSLGSQSWWLFPRINEVDAFLRTIDDARKIVYESHPEVCFAAYDGGALPSKGDEDGLRARVAVLEGLNERLATKVGKIVDERRDGTEWHDRISSSRRDDVVDAAVLAVTAERLELGERTPEQAYPSLPDGDYSGPGESGTDPALEMPMEIVFPGRDPGRSDE
ncbi:DUF429 domain-containing protein [Natrinema salaciae]|uniref:Predicted nuclease (RNAse H fold) n=1 Tax=Natrinema salaciae TaxID=1186196 RepID=A0A1H9NJY8_9EURY|nr:Predicted nuclease (RNAse H fold) [Natrinema salaciae]